MLVKVVLVDINPKMIAAWRQTFEENPEVEIVQASMLEQPVSAWVSPTNSAGRMDGGLDLVIKRHLGDSIEKLVQAQIKSRYSGKMALGHTTCVPTGKVQPAFLISTPTMGGSSEDISDTLNVALACGAAFQAVHTQNESEPGSIRSVALPGLGANTGKVPPEICADLMWTAYNLFREQSFKDYAEMRAALEAELGDLGPSTGAKASAKAKAAHGAAVASATPANGKDAQPKAPKDDFDDAEGNENEDEDEDFDDH